MRMTIMQSYSVMAGLVPAIHVFAAVRKAVEARRGCPAQGRA
jgi:hypothetical protein